ncbi:tRNA (cytidine(34)-2'-O)-methyltransferase [Amorphus orientalis]|uniref:tRNA (cytidine(34)-2'-O)-methyltransferase n=1 Tax=Amorphus orientalis TaxID=649198 RepID=A0AAE3VR55_9HYPH|nr:tRNA (cytidine(34)-2'-O)-methyltransferase [Amorphus orientalis]MDQ0316643.1 tRNA (cytidine/uridine-2'-O-)-methyltransferase [Amorphus orientalis]
MPIRVALYQPDIPQNTGTILRTAACLGFVVDLIEPAGFSLTDRALTRAGLDYIERAGLVRHASWDQFVAARHDVGGRLLLLTTRAETRHVDFGFRDGDTLLFGRESAGAPEAVHAAADHRLRIPMVDGVRSLNLAVAVGLVAGEALRQTGGFAPA